jgi:hypothetical protein
MIGSITSWGLRTAGIHVFTGLKDKLHIASQHTFVIAEQAGCLHQHGGMAVMPADVHDSGILRRVGHRILLRHWQGVHTEALQMFGHPFGRLKLLKSQLRVLVKGPAVFADSVEIGLSFP